MIINRDLEDFPNGVRIHRFAIVEQPELLGSDTIVWAFAKIFAGVVTGSNCSIGTGTYIGRNAKLGSNVRIGDNCHITDHMGIEDDVFIAPHVIFCNDKRPTPNNPRYHRDCPFVCVGASIGVNATILPGVILNSYCLVGAGSVVTHDVPPNTTVVGNPAHPIWDAGGDETTLRDFT